MCVGEILEILKSLLTPLIAIIATFIAYQQWKTNQQKVNSELYDRRLRIYEEVREILSIIQQDAKVSIENLLKFRTSVSEADFLFGPEISEYIDEIYNRGLELCRWNDEYRDHTQEYPVDYDHALVVRNKHQELNWLREQFVPAKKKFKKYLDINNKK